MLAFLPNVLLMEVENLDCTLWEWNPNSTFMIKNAYTSLNDGGLRCPMSSAIWKTGAPLKIGAFLWLVVNKTVLTWDNLRRRNW